jgi:predicted AlkP superfamily pyrophosphatase or phosphodiesterase
MLRLIAPAFGSIAVLVGILFAVAGFNPSPALRTAGRSEHPTLGGNGSVKLVVLLVFDQMRGDYLEKWRDQFGEGGFKRLTDDGAWFLDCHYPYATTTTGPGHASLMSGAPPDRTGIINNEWYDRGGATEAYCAGLPKYAIVPTPATKPKWAGTPDRLLSPTVGDVLKTVTNGRGKVIGLSLKDRSAIFPSGHKPDGAYWFDKKFVTSTYYRDGLPKWVEEFNKSGKAESYFGKTWDHVKPTEVYDRLVGPDKSLGEGNGTGQGGVFPHKTDGGENAPGSRFYTALANSPFGNDLLLEFTKAAIEAEQLGADDVPDLLTVSFSSNDLIGHTWGPDSHEVMDATIRSDAQVANLLKYLDEKIGKGKYAVIVSADHGICPIPEVAARQGKDAKRISAAKLVLGAETFLRGKYADAEPVVENQPAQPAKEGEDPPLPKTRWMEKVSPPYIYLNHRLIKSKGLKVEDVANELAGWARQQDGVLAVYTYTDLVGNKVSETDSIGPSVKKAFHPDRSGDLFVVLKPYHLIGSVSVGDRLVTGTTHGSPHDYDTHAPLVVYGPGVAGGKRTEKVTPLHAAPIAAQFLGIPSPTDALYPVPATLRK